MLFVIIIQFELHENGMRWKHQILYSETIHHYLTDPCWKLGHYFLTFFAEIAAKRKHVVNTLSRWLSFGFQPNFVQRNYPSLSNKPLLKIASLLLTFYEIAAKRKHVVNALSRWLSFGFQPNFACCTSSPLLTLRLNWILHIRNPGNDIGITIVCSRVSEIKIGNYWRQNYAPSCM